jgi:hypothetical protein
VVDKRVSWGRSRNERGIDDGKDLEGSEMMRRDETTVLDIRGQNLVIRSETGLLDTLLGHWARPLYAFL